MTEGLSTTIPDPPTPTPPPQSRVGLVALAALCASLGGMLGGSAVGVVQAGRASGATAAMGATPDAGGALLSQEANPETAGDGVMDDLDEAPSDAGAVVVIDEAAAEAGVVAVAAAAAAGATPRRRDGAVVTSDNVPEGPAQGYVDGRAVRIVVTRLDAKPVEVHTAAAFTRMRDAAQRDRVRLRIASGFRTMAHQQALYRAYRRGRGNLAAVPGHSNHQSGHALDLNTSTPGVLRWLERNARRFGFRRTVPTEPWHWEWW
jgi:hypothetical protein